MSDLSFLIQNQNQVDIDQNILQKYQQNQQQNDMKKTSINLNKVLSSKQIRINKNKTQIGIRNKSRLQKSFKNLFSSQNQDQNIKTSSAATQTLDRSDKQQLMKIQMRIQALQQNQKRTQHKIGVDFFHIKEQIQRKNKEQNQQFQQVKKIKNDLGDTKKKIGQLLMLISKGK